MVLAYDTSSYGALQLYEVSSKYLEQFSAYIMDTKLHLLMFKGEQFEKIQARVMVPAHDKYCISLTKTDQTQTMGVLIFL